MNKILSYKIPSAISISIITIIVVILLLYTVFEIGKIHGRYEIMSVEKNHRIPERTKSQEKAGKINIEKLKSRTVFNKIDGQYKLTDVRNLISVKSPKDIKEKRKELVHFLWGTDKLPKSRYPSKINKRFRDERYKLLYKESLERIDHVLVEMEFDLESNIYHFIPKSKNGRLILFHQGHSGDFINNLKLINSLLNEGFSVAGFCMPLLGLNNKPEIYDSRFGFYKLTRHEYIRFLTPEKGHPVKYFLEPVIVFLNYAKPDYSDVSMIGISGGAWTTTLVSAIDERIMSNFPVAGSYPMYLRFNSKRDWGDYEQTVPELYRVCNYLELYILGSYGRGRSQLQVINRYDSCCFAGIKWQTYYTVLKGFSEDINEMTWDLFLDESHIFHIISPKTQSIILSRLKGKNNLAEVHGNRTHPGRF